MLSGALEASKALLEEQLEAAQERCARLHETQRENLLLRTRLGEARAVRLSQGPPVTLSSVTPGNPNGPPGFSSAPCDPLLLFSPGDLAHTLGPAMVRRACLTPSFPQELDSVRHQVDQLAEENVELELELQRSLEPPLGSPGEGE